MPDDQQGIAGGHGEEVGELGMGDNKKENAAATGNGRLRQKRIRQT